MTDYTPNTIEIKPPSANVAFCDICEQWQEKELLGSHLAGHCSNATSSIEAAKPPPQAIQPTKLQRCAPELQLEPANEQTTRLPSRSPYCDLGKKYNRASQIASHKSKIAAAEKLLATAAATTAAVTTNSPAPVRNADVTARSAQYVPVGRPAPSPAAMSSPATHAPRPAPARPPVIHAPRQTPARSLAIHPSPQPAAAPSLQASREDEVYCTTCDEYITQSIKSHKKRSKKHRSLVAAIRAERSRFYCHVCKSLMPVDDMANHISSRWHLARVTGGQN